MRGNIWLIFVFIGGPMMIIGGVMICTNSHGAPYRTVNHRIEILEVQMDLIKSEIGKINKEKK